MVRASEAARGTRRPVRRAHRHKHTYMHMHMHVHVRLRWLSHGLSCAEPQAQPQPQVQVQSRVAAVDGMGMQSRVAAADGMGMHVLRWTLHCRGHQGGARDGRGGGEVQGRARTGNGNAA